MSVAMYVHLHVHSLRMYANTPACECEYKSLSGRHSETRVHAAALVSVEVLVFECGMQCLWVLLSSKMEQDLDQRTSVHANQITKMRMWLSVNRGGVAIGRWKLSKQNHTQPFEAWAK
jgi:hypothetical protein